VFDMYEPAIIGFALLLVLADLMYGFSNNFNKSFLQEVPPLVIAGFAYSCMAVPACIFLFSTDFVSKLGINSLAFAGADIHALKALGYIAILGSIGSALPMFL